MYAYNTHYDTLWYTILQYFTLPQNDPPWIDKGIQWPLRRFLHLPQFTNLSKQLMDNNILSQQTQHPQHNNNNTSLKTIMDNNKVFRLQRHHRPCFQWLSRKWRNYIHVTWWNSEAYFKKFAKSTKDQALSNSFLDFFMETTYYQPKQVRVNVKIFPVINLDWLVQSDHFALDGIMNEKSQHWWYLKIMITII